MDTFYEQIVSMKKTGKDYAIIAGSFLLALLICYINFLFIFIILPPLGIVVMFGVIWALYKVFMITFVEYEYIFTNGDLDIDKITAKSSRKRMITIKCGKVEKFAKYTAEVTPPASVKKVFTFCDKNDDRARYIIVPTKKHGTVMVIFAPDDRICEVVEKSIPRIAQ